MVSMMSSTAWLAVLWMIMDFTEEYKLLVKRYSAKRFLKEFPDFDACHLWTNCWRRSIKVVQMDKIPEVVKDSLLELLKIDFVENMSLMCSKMLFVCKILVYCLVYVTVCISPIILVLFLFSAQIKFQILVTVAVF